MRSNKEMREEAWKVVRGKWFWRMVSAGLLLNCIAQLVLGLIKYLYKDMEIQTWTGFLQSKLQALQGGLDLTVPSTVAGWRMTGASVFELFFTYLFGAILAFGLAVVVLKAIRDDEKSWFSDAFGGYRRPLEVTWFLVLMNLRVFLWSLLLFIPGLVAIYRYRQAWYVKVENPDWSASRCLAESGKMMKGYKWRAFEFDCSYLGWFLLLIVSVSTGTILTLSFSGNSVLAAAGGMVVFASLALFAYVVCYYFVGRAVFYREVKAQQPPAEKTE